MENEAIRDLLQRFQDGYTKRNLEAVDQFMELFVPDPVLEVIGTGAVTPGTGEWCLGPEAARDLVASDWEFWGDVRLDVDGANVYSRGEVGWLATTGTVTDTIPPDQRYQGYLEYVREMLADETLDEETRVLEIVRLGNDIVIELPRRETFTWPFRFTAVVVKHGGDWLFHQMQFSFPTTRAPDERLL